MIFARAALESMIASMAAKRIDEDQKRGLRAIVQSMREPTRANEVDQVCPASAPMGQIRLIE